MKVKKLRRHLRKLSNDEFLVFLATGKFTEKQAILVATVAELRFPTPKQ